MRRAKEEAAAQAQLRHRQQEGLLVLHNRIQREYFRARAGGGNDDDDDDDNDGDIDGDGIEGGPGVAIGDGNGNDNDETLEDDFEGDLPSAWEAVSVYFPVLAHTAKHSLAYSRRFSQQRERKADLLSLLKVVQE